MIDLTLQAVVPLDMDKMNDLHRSAASVFFMSSVVLIMCSLSLDSAVARRDSPEVQSSQVLEGVEESDATDRVLGEPEGEGMYTMPYSRVRKYLAFTLLGFFIAPFVLVLGVGASVGLSSMSVALEENPVILSIFAIVQWATVALILAVCYSFRPCLERVAVSVNVQGAVTKRAQE
ncbi:hypothetical protein KIPB_006896 [Kipferlia bialata]|uniref:Transmembrane protein n=1 Tax=Kipferlia bialata TaxID=797122 RepID=A0A9K3GJK8_9EUKA|nr:hypothetical protein KIPB_006896 [Kipferlia bialata]|eukprot:g6896.t1